MPGDSSSSPRASESSCMGSTSSASADRHARSDSPVSLAEVYDALRRVGEHLHRQGGGSRKRSAGLGLWLSPGILPSSLRSPAGAVVLIYFKGRRWSSTGIHAALSLCPHHPPLRQGPLNATRKATPPLPSGNDGAPDASRAVDEPAELCSTSSSLRSSPASPSSPPPWAPHPDQAAAASPACACAERRSLPLLVLTTEEAFFLLSGDSNRAEASTLVLFDAETARQLTVFDLLFLLLERRTEPPTTSQSDCLQQRQALAEAAGDERPLPSALDSEQVKASGCRDSKRRRGASASETPGHTPCAAREGGSPPRGRIPKCKQACDPQQGPAEEEATQEGGAPGRRRSAPPFEDGASSRVSQFAESRPFTWQDLQVYLQLKSLGLPIRNREGASLARAIRRCPIHVSPRFLALSVADVGSPAGLCQAPSADAVGSVPFLEIVRAGSAKAEARRVESAGGSAKVASCAETRALAPWFLSFERKHQRRQPGADEAPGGGLENVPRVCQRARPSAPADADCLWADSLLGAAADSADSESPCEACTESDWSLSEGEESTGADLGERPAALMGPRTKRAASGEGLSAREPAGNSHGPLARCATVLPVFAVSPEAAAGPFLLSEFGRDVSCDAALDALPHAEASEGHADGDNAASSQFGGDSSSQIGAHTTAPGAGEPRDMRSVTSSAVVVAPVSGEGNVAFLAVRKFAVL
ncbi:hypothetical protein BESB_018210 [Besnoitia besnoiti]|uniref:Uncharacterized protein n=1 Tax=Besnoitia besnoiti TaxID=94643 RepID=A0A2A9MA01_BESBE|nr:hypothetical protein BESB_018210 [Besnoitia besnoiti]PFH32503.1 hypothetical protein BESB_018210 [Besnoitia besnoiti]